MGKSREKQATDKQHVFVEIYLKTWNATEAARQAGYKGNDATLASVGYANLRKAEIREQIDARLAEFGMSANEVLARLASHARGDLSPFLSQDVDEVSFDLTTEQAKENLHLIKKIKSKTKRGTKDNGEEWEEHETEIEVHDPQAALVHLGRYHKLFTDKAENEQSGELVIRVVRDGSRTQTTNAAPSATTD